MKQELNVNDLMKIVVTEAGSDAPLKGVSVRAVLVSDPTVIIEKSPLQKVVSM